RQVLYTFPTRRSSDLYLHQIKSDNQLIELVLEEKLKPNDYNHRYFAQVKSIDNQSSCGTILLNINKNDYPEEPDIGLHVKVYSKDRKSTRLNSSHVKI